MAVLILALTLGCLLIVVPPLGISMENLLIRNKVYRNLNTISRSALPVDFNFQMTSLSARIGQEAIFVRGDIVAPPGVPPGLIQRSDVNLMRDRLSDVVQRPVELELGIVHETILRSAENDSS